MTIKRRHSFTLTFFRTRPDPTGFQDEKEYEHEISCDVSPDEAPQRDPGGNVVSPGVSASVELGDPTEDSDTAPALTDDERASLTEQALDYAAYLERWDR
jgi:hypothetical protein